MRNQSRLTKSVNYCLVIKAQSTQNSLMDYKTLFGYGNLSVKMNFSKLVSPTRNFELAETFAFVKYSSNCCRNSKFFDNNFIYKVINNRKIKHSC